MINGKVDRPGKDTPGGQRVERKCQVCGTVFWPLVFYVNRGQGIHCSNKCAQRAQLRITVCKACGKKIKSRSGKVYHDECRNAAMAEIARRRKTRVCRNCNMEFTKRNAKASNEFCAPTCAVQHSRAKLTINGVEFTAQEVASAIGVTCETLRSRIRDGLLRGVDPVQWALTVGSHGVGNKSGKRGVKITHNGRSLNMTEWAAEAGISANALKKRLLKGMPFDEAIKPKSQSKSPRSLGNCGGSRLAQKPLATHNMHDRAGTGQGVARAWRALQRR